ncbi:MAG: carbonic anhydrase [Planctomycetia bacterium]|jgi:carbonic anhydrase|nr:carbonic anhydrase [Planctomycetia bacterium]
MPRSLLEQNARFVAGEFRTHADYYQHIAVEQHPKVIWIGCADSRVSEDIITGSRPGTMFVHRNIANIVSYNDPGLMAVLEYGLLHLKIKDVIVCGHTRCGGIEAVEKGVDEYCIADWLCMAAGAKERSDRIAAARGMDAVEKLDLLAMENVRSQLGHLNRLGLIRELRRQGAELRIHGWLYRIETGKIDVLIEGETGEPTELLRQYE